MNKEFVPYEEALVLKELGFDEPCMGYYSTGDEHLFFRDRNPEQPNQAPLYQQAFRWFREEHGLRHIVGWDYEEFHFETIVLETDDWFNSKNYSSYEEAELACLRKLMEIVNQNKDE